MCRLLGIVASEPTEYRLVLKEAPRSMAALSKVHRDGWGIAVFGDETGEGWHVERGIDCAGEDQRFHELAVGSRGETLIAHIRQRTIGVASLENTHPFRSGRWIFAHNGTIKDLDWLERNISAARRAEVRGETDSELFFAFLLTRLDAHGLANAPASFETDAVVGKAAREARSRVDFGAINFLLSEGDAIYAHRWGRTLWLLERGPEDVVRASRRAYDGTLVQTPWSQRRRAVFIASEHLTDEPWQAIDEGMMLRIDRVPSPRWRLVAA